MFRSTMSTQKNVTMVILVNHPTDLLFIITGNKDGRKSIGKHDENWWWWQYRRKGIWLKTSYWFFSLLMRGIFNHLSDTLKRNLVRPLEVLKDNSHWHKVMCVMESKIRSITTWFTILYLDTERLITMFLFNDYNWRFTWKGHLIL